MANVPQDVQASLANLLQSLTATDNNLRSSAERSLDQEWTAQRPDLLLVGLATQAQQNPDPTLRSLATVLLRRIAFKISVHNEEKVVWDTLAPQATRHIRELVLQNFAQEQLTPVRNKICDTLAEIARYIIEGASDGQQPWPELLPALFEASKSPELHHRESAYRVFTAIPNVIGKQHAGLLKRTFAAGLEDPEREVRVSALKATCGFLLQAESGPRNELASLLPSIFNILPQLKEHKENEHLTSSFAAITEVAETHPKLFRSLFSNIVQFGLAVVHDISLDNAARQASLELLVTFSEGLPSLCRKDGVYTKEVVSSCLALMTDVGSEHGPDLQEWLQTEDLDADESDENHIVAEQALDRLARKLGGKAILPPAFMYLPNMLSSGKWQERHAALMAISSIAEGCEKFMRGELGRVLDMVLPLLRDQNPRVRWAAANAIGQMSTDFADDIQRLHHNQVLSALIPALDSPEARVQAHAAAACVNFAEEADNKVLEPYLDTLLEKLLGLLQSPKRYLQEQAVTTIATVADAAEQKFNKYYDAIMPLLMNVLKQDGTKEYRLLRGKTIECATLIALAVGKERFAPNATEMIQTLGNIQVSVVDADDPQASYLIAAWGRICRIMGQDFVPYLSAVMPPLLTLAKAKPDFTILDEESDREKYSQEEGWDFIPIHGQQIGIKTSVLEDKCTAVEMLICYAAELKEAFNPYVDEVMSEIVLPGLRFYFHDGVRTASAKTAPLLLNARKKAVGAGSQQLLNLWRPLAAKLLDVIAIEPSSEMLAEFFQCFYECMEVVGTDALTKENIEAFISAVETQIKDLLKRTETRAQQAAAGEIDLEEDEEMIEEVENDENLMGDINKTMHVFFKQHKSSFLPFWERLLPIYQMFLGGADSNLKQWAICGLDDIIEFTTPDSIKYKDLFLPALANGLSDESPEVRQAASYGFGAAGQHGGELYSDICAAAVPGLFQFFENPNARDEANVYATENACIALAKICRFNSSKVGNLDMVVSHWVKTLPVTNDDTDAPYAYMFLAELMESNHQAVTTQASAVFSAVTAVLEADILSGKTLDRVVLATKSFMSALSQDQIQAAMSAVPPEQQQAASKYFQ